MGFIYKISNSINNKIYIGQTKRSIAERFKQHEYDYCHKRYNSLLHQAMRELGFKNFSIEEIEECPDDLLDEREVYWINYYNSYQDGYNLTTGGQKGCSCPRYNEEEIIRLYLKYKSLNKVSKEVGCCRTTVKNVLKRNNIEWLNTEEATKNACCLFINQIDPKTNRIVNCFRGAKEASEQLKNSSESMIQQCARSEEPLIYCGYGWVYQGKPIPDFSNAKEIKRQKKPVIQIDISTGKKVNEFDSISEAAKFIGAPNPANICGALKGKTKTAYGYKWKYLDEWEV